MGGSYYSRLAFANYAFTNDLLRRKLKDPEEVTNKMYGCGIDIEVTLSRSLICASVYIYSIVDYQHPTCSVRPNTTPVGYREWGGGEGKLLLG